MEDKLKELEQKGAAYREQLAKQYAAYSLDAKESQLIHGTWQFESMMLSYIQDGETEKLREYLTAASKTTEFKEGKLAQDPLRQAKNILIGMVAVVGKIAGIGGGIDIEDCYRLIDLYTQECEKAENIEVVTLLRYNMIMDFAEAVRQAKLPKDLSREVFSSIQYIADHSHETIGIDDVASFVHRSRSYITRQFRKEIGKSITEYITDAKIRDAKRLLRYSDFSLGEIATTLAFSSQAYFQTVFKQKTGMTPGEYRNEHTVNRKSKIQ